MKILTSRRPKIVLAFAMTALAALLLSGCGLLGDDNDGSSTGTTSPVRVVEGVMSTEVNEARQATGFVGRIFPAGIQAVHAVLTVEGAAPGTVIDGRWFQLSVPNAPAEGAQVSDSSVTLTAETLEEGRSRIALNVTSSGGLPEGDWVVRIYADGVFIRTMAFVITSQVSIMPEGGATPGQGSEPPAATQIPVIAEHTVVAGDSLQSIADQFKADSETAEQFLNRLIQVNQLQPQTGIAVGQVLKIPGPQQ